MNSDQIVKDIIIAMIEKGYFADTEDVCEAYSKIARTVTNPFNNNL